ncbi:D-alanyl-D-alanine carboxypeptidase [Clostridiaceae bacterium M8S5]|nr:D-alanyl-D-alanine carboxypeptidase [Clostridiaceae bacterium M8S5]
MKQRFTIIFAVILFMLLFNFSYAQTPWISAKSAVLIDADTGTILAQKNMDTQIYPASTTKILTGILAIEKCKLDELVTVDEKTPYEIKGQQIYLMADEVITMKDLLNALLIQSANDAALVIAKEISDSQEKFAKLMNEKAKEIGAKNTNFVTPNGLHNDKHVTTAYDMAMIARYAMKNQTFRSIVSNYTYTINPTNKQPKPRYLKSKNKLLYGVGSGNKITYDGITTDIKYIGATGIKTGYTPEASNCIVASASRNGQNLIVAIFYDQSNELFIDAHKLFNYGFKNFTNKKISSKNEFIKNVPIEHGSMPFVTAIIGKNVTACVPVNSSSKIERKITINNDLSVPIAKDQVIGKVEYLVDNKSFATANVVAAEPVHRKAMYSVVNSTEKGFLWLFTKWWFWLIVLFILWRIYIYKRRKRKRKFRSKYKVYTK